MKSTLSIVLLSAAVSVQAAADASAVTSTVFSQIQRYTQFAGAAYSENCPTPPFGSKIVKFFNNTNTDTQAYLFQSGSEQILSFRGSSSPKDFDTDFNFTLTGASLPFAAGGSNGLVHTGFQNALQSILPDLQAALGSGSSSLTITGHSLGAGLASLASGIFKAKQVFTFGEPRNGDSGFASFINARYPNNYYRVTHYNDGVPQIPPTQLSYQHHGTEYWESLQSGNTAASTKKQSGNTEPQGGVLSTNFGNNPINGAHIQYTDVVLAAMLFNPGCGFVAPS